MNALEFGVYLKETRQGQKLSLRKLEELSGVSNAYLSQIETGKRGIPNPDFLRKIAEPLGVSYQELLERAGYIDHLTEGQLIPGPEQTVDLNTIFQNVNLTFKGQELNENQKKTMLRFVNALLNMSEDDQS